MSIVLPYDPKKLPRELTQDYIPASPSDIEHMMSALGISSFDQLFNHIPKSLQLDIPNPQPGLDYYQVAEALASIANENKDALSFIADGLPVYKVHPIVDEISSIRRLTTAYTPYQPERGQGTLIALWIYQCMMAELTGFEAINASLYDRSTALFEAINASLRIHSDRNTILICDHFYPGDKEVIKTLTADTSIQIEWIPLNPSTGLIDISTVRQKVEALKDSLSALVFSQVNTLGLLEDVDTLTDIAEEAGISSIANIDPMHLAPDCLKPPSAFGKHGTTFIVGEAQHMAIDPNFGGPGLGLFGVRFNESNKNYIRTTPGRFVGKAKDITGHDCFVMVMSTREQHIRKEKATSNICSNQSFIATLAGASILAKGESGLKASSHVGVQYARKCAEYINHLEGITIAFPHAAFYNEIVVEVNANTNLNTLLEKANHQNIHLGVNVSDRIDDGKKQLLKISFSDIHTDQDLEKLKTFLSSEFKHATTSSKSLDTSIPSKYLRQNQITLPHVTEKELITFYKQLGDLNMSPDEACYPLGSCTMKYNPYLNDWTANLKKFTTSHPQSPTTNIQGSLHILYEVQQKFKSITGLAAVTTQPVAGAQGELVGLKLFQAYHRNNNESHRRVIFIPRSAHGTNFATATVAGYNESQNGKIVILESNSEGQIDIDDFNKKLAEHKNNLAGIMITNPNTCGIFEKNFRQIADAVHAAGGLVYMDGANMNAIANWVDLEKLGVDAVHSNLHKTWTIPHGGGGPGDAIVAVSKKLADYLPGYQIVKSSQRHYEITKPSKSIGSFHRHFGNFAHKVRCLTYLLRLGDAGIRRMSAVAVLSACYLMQKLKLHFPMLPHDTENVPRMHEFILTLSDDLFNKIEATGIGRASIISRVGKLFLDFGFHAPTVAWPETYGLMIEPTESFTKAELDRLAEAIIAIKTLIIEVPKILESAPYFTPIRRIDEVAANRQLVVSEKIIDLPILPKVEYDLEQLNKMSISEIKVDLLHRVSNFT